MYPDLLPSTLRPDWSVTIYNGSSTPYTLKIMTWASLTLVPLVIAYQGWSYWVFRKRISAAAIPAADGLPRRPS
jgi:cytochrome d ubiquinol oxidase subunit II